MAKNGSDSMDPWTKFTREVTQGFKECMLKMCLCSWHTVGWQLAAIIRDTAVSRTNQAAIARSGGWQNARKAGELVDPEVDELNQEAIREVGAIEPLVALLKHGDERGKVAAAEALRYLSLDKENQKVIAQAGAIDPMLVLFRDGSDRAKQAAAYAIRNLAYDAENRKVITSKDAITPLVTLLATGSDDGKTAAARALVSLAEQEEVQKLFAAKAVRCQRSTLCSRSRAVLLALLLARCKRCIRAPASAGSEGCARGARGRAARWAAQGQQ